jgi:hypothetical protein
VRIRSRSNASLTAVLVAVTGLLGAAAGPAGGAAGGRLTLEVSRHGHDTWSRPEAARRPLATITRAVRLARPGDTIVVHAGGYVGPVGYGAVPGRRDAPIRMRAAPGERVVIKGTLQLEKADYWSVAGIDVTARPRSARTEFLVKFDGGTGWEFLDAEVWGARGVSNIMISGSRRNGVPTGYRIARTCVHDNRARGDAFMNDHGIYLMPGYTSGPGLIERNLFFGFRNGAAVKAAGPSSVTGAARVVFRRNTVTRAAAGVIVGYRSNRVAVRDNLIGAQLKRPPRGARYVRNYDAAVIGNHVSGRGNAVADNAVWAFPRAVHATGDSSRRITERRTAWLAPRFASTGCGGFRPRGPAARYGRWS